MEIDSPRTIRSQVGVPTALFGALESSGASSTDRALGDHVLLVGECGVVFAEFVAPGGIRLLLVIGRFQ